MIRVLAYIILVFLIAVGAAWLADRPGEVVLHWQGYEIRTSLLVAAAAIVAAMAVIAIVWSVLRAIFRSPRALRSHLGRRKRDRGYRALNAGMIAVGAGDPRAARKAAEDSRALLGPEPLVMLLTAQAAQLAGDGDGARAAFQALAAKPDTRLLGLHGLFIEAERDDQHEAARHFAEEAADAVPRVAWAGTAVFDYAARDGDWTTAATALEANVQAGLVDREDAPRIRAALLTARALEIEQGEPDRARLLALDALKLRPGFAPAAALAARLYSRTGNYRRAARVLEVAWKADPHPEIAEAYAAIRPGDSVVDRLKRLRHLADTRANHPEGSMAIARSAIDAGDWAAARAALEGLSKAPTERVCLLMAEIEDRQNNDQGRVRDWLTRALAAPRDPAWVADGQVFERWLPASPVTGKVGAVEWMVPPPAPRRPGVLEAGEPVDPVASVAALDLLRLESHASAVEASPDIDEMVDEDELPMVDAAPVVSVPEPPQPPMAVPSPASAASPVASAPAKEPVPSADPVDRRVAASSAPANETTPPPSVSPAPKSPALATASGAVEDEPPVPHAPDDPGPQPHDPEDAPARSRFRLFGQ